MAADSQIWRSHASTHHKLWNDKHLSFHESRDKIFRKVRIFTNDFPFILMLSLSFTCWNYFLQFTNVNTRQFPKTWPLHQSSQALVSITYARTPFLSNISRWKGNINLCLWEIRTSDSFDCKRDFIIGTHKGNLINRNPGQKKSSNRRWAWLSVNRRHNLFSGIHPSLHSKG